jgi:peptidoglycan/xylan/chitin deacetylase (PgdA/CDA1 family)
VEIGAHTVNHPALSTQTPQEQRAEIRQSKMALEAQLGRPVTGFAYPYGLYSSDTVDAVRDAGFDYACACDSSIVRGHSSPLLIPRIDTSDCGGDVFEKYLSHCLRGMGPN